MQTLEPYLAAKTMQDVFTQTEGKTAEKRADMPICAWAQRANRPTYKPGLADVNVATPKALPMIAKMPSATMAHGSLSSGTEHVEPPRPIAHRLLSAGAGGVLPSHEQQTHSLGDQSGEP